MTPQIVAEFSKKHGVNFLLICAIFWLNNRLSEVEAKLYDCLDDKATYQRSQEKHVAIEPIYAVLPKQINYGKSKRKMERKDT